MYLQSEPGNDKRIAFAIEKLSGPSKEVVDVARMTLRNTHPSELVRAVEVIANQMIRFADNDIQRHKHSEILDLLSKRGHGREVANALMHAAEQTAAESRANFLMNKQHKPTTTVSQVKDRFLKERLLGV